MKNIKIKYFNHNLVGNDYIIGDIHGCYDQFMDLLNKINFNKKTDRVFSVGDLIDRGPKSMECLSLFYETWFHMVYANHEQMMVEGLSEIFSNSSNSYDSWIYNGGQWHFSEDIDTLKGISQDICQNAPYIIVIGKDTPNRINIVHAEIFRNKDQNLATDSDIDNWNFDDINLNSFTWGRMIAEGRSTVYRNFIRENISKTYCGHTPTKVPYEHMNHRFIDGGAVYGLKYEDTESTMYLVNITTEELIKYKIPSGEVSSEDMYNYFKKE